MTKADLIKSIGTKVENVNQKDIASVLDALAETVVDVVKADDDVTIPGIGKVSVKTVPERSGVAALAGGKEWTKPAHDEICFKMSKSVKELA